jgi:DNA-binding response OmpR family regulator
MRLLLAEDDPEAASVLANGLREHAYVVDVAADGRAAFGNALAREYDMIILDVMLPGVDGLQVCRRLRTAGRATPILMLTARGGVEDRVEGLDAGADDYVPKPFHFPELLARVRALLRRGPVLTPAALNVGDLTIDTRARRVRRAGREIQLTTKEYTMLSYLARHQEHIVSRSDISDNVWDEHCDPASNVIDVYVQRLRRKVDDGHDRKLIHTRRGVGYVMSQSGDDGTA